MDRGELQPQEAGTSFNTCQPTLCQAVQDENRDSRADARPEGLS